MRSTYKLFCLTACAVLLISLCTFALTGCRDSNIPASVPSTPAGSSEPAPSSSFSAPSSPSSATTASEVSSSSKPAVSSSTSAGGTGGTGTSSYSGKTYSKAVTDSKKETLSTVKITANGVYLSNKTITGDLIIDKGVADGKVTLENVTVKKTIYVYGGGENSVYLKSVQAAKLVSASTVSRPRIVAQDNTNIGKTDIRYDTLLAYDGLNYGAKGFNHIETVKTSQFLTVLKLYNIGVYSLIINDDTNLFLMGTSSVSYVTANSPAYIEGGLGIGTLECNSKNISVDYSPSYITSKSGIGYYTPTIFNPSSSSSSSSTSTLATPYLSGTISGVSWSEVLGAAHGYEMRINKQYSSGYASLSFSPTESRWKNVQEYLTTQASPTGYYEVRVKAYGTASANESAFSNVLTFYYTNPGTWLSISALSLDASDPSKYMVKWTGANANSYNVTVSTDNNYTNQIYNKDITAQEIDLCAALTTAFTSRHYYLKVTAKTAFDQLASTKDFIVTRADTPTSLVCDSAKKVTWNGPSGASYVVTVGTTAYPVGTAKEFSLSDDTAFSLGHDYSVSVVTLGVANTILNSIATAPITVSKPSLGQLAAPANLKVTRTGTSLNVNWDSSPNATAYRVSYKRGSDTSPTASATLAGISHVFNGVAIASTSDTSLTVSVEATATGYTTSIPATFVYDLPAYSEDFSAGNGSPGDSYIITGASDFAKISSPHNHTNKVFVQTANFATAVTSPIASFSGTYNGGGKTILVNIDDGTSSNVGLFGTITSAATVKNIVIADASLVVGSSNVGMIAGINYGTIDNCDLNTTGTAYVQGSSYVGGICGINYTTGTIKNCNYAGSLYKSDSSQVTASTTSYGLIAGGSSGNTSINNTVVGAPYAIDITGGTAPSGGAGGDGGITSPDGVAVPDAMALRLLPWLSILSSVL